jgi:hypothetical protein
MSYQSQADLEHDSDFQGRVNSATFQQANVYKDDQRPDFVALSNGILVGNYTYSSTFVRLAAAGPGIAEKAETPNGIDQTLVTDGDLLALTQANFPTVVELFFNEDGTPKPPGG